MTDEPDVLLVGTGPLLARAERELAVNSVESGVSACEFDSETDRWQVRTASGEQRRPRVLVLTEDAAEQAFPAGVPGPRYLGVTSPALANLFVVGDQETIATVRRCLALMRDAGATLIRVRTGSAREYARFTGAARPRRRFGIRRAKGWTWNPVDFELSDVEERESDAEYSGPAELRSDSNTATVTVHLSGHFEPLDGLFHWYGRIEGAVPFDRTRGATSTLTIGSGTAVPTTFADVDPWGNQRITGTGQPPYTLEPIEV